MKDYKKLVEALRCNQGNGLCPYADCEYKSKNAPICMPTRLTNDAAAAIEDLQAEVQELKRVNLEIFEDLPKLGKWIYHPKDAIEMMFTLPKCSICGHESSDALNYCPNCGAKMMEVQE